MNGSRPKRFAWLISSLSIAAVLGCATPRPVSAGEEHALAVEPSPRAMEESVRLSAEDAAPCTDEPPGRAPSELGSGDVGQEVVVEDVLRLGPVLCSRMPCEVPCCNRCGALLMLGGGEQGKGGLHLAKRNGEPINCGGSECDFSCPGLAPGNRYRVTGTLEELTDAEGRSILALDVTSVCRRATGQPPAEAQ